MQTIIDFTTGLFIIIGFILLLSLLLLWIGGIFEKIYFKVSDFGRLLKYFHRGKMEKEDSRKFYSLLDKYFFKKK